MRVGFAGTAMVLFGIVTIVFVPFAVTYRVFYVLGSNAGDLAGQFLGWGAVSVLMWLLATRVLKHFRDIELHYATAIHLYQNEEAGPFEQWFDNQDIWDDADRIPVKIATQAVIKSYGGKPVVSRLLGEGFIDVVFQDIAEVMGDTRSSAVIYQIRFDIAKNNPFAAALGLIVGFNIATRR